MTDICIIGGGPAGITAALSAASRGKKVTIIERNEEPLKKLLLTGSGKCNYSNSDLKSDYYNFGQNHPFSKVIEEYDSEWLENFFMEKGMLTYKKECLKYPRNERSDTLKNLLLDLISKEGVKTINNKKVVSVQKNDESDNLKEYNDSRAGFVVKFEDGEEIGCEKLIIATGGKAYPSLGSDGAGYRLARELGHSVSFTYPVLTRLLTDDKDIRDLSGIRFKARVSAEAEGKIVCVEDGDLQFAENALSGICIFNLSRFVSKPVEENKECFVIVDFLPEMSEGEITEYLKKTTSDDANFLVNTFGEKTAAFIEKRVGKKMNEAGAGSDKKEEITAFVIKNARIRITGHDSFNFAQVTKGGVNIDEVDENLSSKICPGLFFAGEVLDVDGKCGGYNLHWAFASGYKAGLIAAKD